MPIYQLRCAGGHSFEVIQSFAAELPACPQCGGQTAKVPSTFGFAGQAARSLPPPPEAMPQTWRGAYEGNREYVASLRRTAEQRRALEERHPELAGDRRPILAHEGRYEAAPLRAGDAPAGGPGQGAPAGGQSAAGHSHGADSQGGRSHGADSQGGRSHGPHSHGPHSHGPHSHGPRSREGHAAGPAE